MQYAQTNYHINCYSNKKKTKNSQNRFRLNEFFSHTNNNKKKTLELISTDYTISVLKFTKKMLNKFHLIWHSKNLFNSLKHPRISHTNGKESMNQMSFTSAEMFLFSLIKTLNSNRVEAMSTLRYCLRCLSPCSKWFFTNIRHT